MITKPTIEGLAAYGYGLDSLRWYTYQASTIVEALRTGDGDLSS